MTAGNQHRKIENKIPTAKSCALEPKSENRRTIAASRVPAPPKEIGIIPINMARGISAQIVLIGTITFTA